MFRLISFAALAIATAPVPASEVGTAGGFCAASPEVSLDAVLDRRSENLNKRVRVHALLRTDGKAYATLSTSEHGTSFVLTTIDNESSLYAKDHPRPVAPNDLIGDFKAKLREKEGRAYKFDMRKIVRYRQVVDVCGRLVGPPNDRRFAVDDLQVLNSYLLSD